MSTASTDKQILYAGYKKNSSNLRLKTGVLTRVQVESIVKIFINNAKELANKNEVFRNDDGEIVNNDLFKYKNDINSSIYRLSLLNSKDDKSPMAFLYFNNPVLYYLAIGLNPDGSTRTGIVKKSDEELKNLKIPNTFEQFLKEVKEINRLKKERPSKLAKKPKRRGEESDSDDDSEEEDPNFDDKMLKIYNSMAYKEVNIMPIIPPIYFRNGDTTYCIEIGEDGEDRLTEQQLELLEKKAYEEGIAEGLTVDEIEPPRSDFLIVERSFVQDLTYFYKEKKSPNRLISKFITESWVKSENIYQQIYQSFSIYNTDSSSIQKDNILGIKNERELQKKQYPLIKLMEKTEGKGDNTKYGYVFLIEFSSRTNHYTDASFARQIEGSLIVTNPTNPSKKVELKFFYDVDDSNVNKVNRNVVENIQENNSNSGKNKWTGKIYSYGQNDKNWRENSFKQNDDEKLKDNQHMENVWSRKENEQPKVAENVWSRREYVKEQPKVVENVWSRKEISSEKTQQKEHFLRKSVKTEPEPEKELEPVYYPIEMLTYRRSKKQKQESYPETVTSSRKTSVSPRKTVIEDDGFTKVSTKKSAKSNPVKIIKKEDILNKTAGKSTASTVGKSKYTLVDLDSDSD